MSAPIPLTRPPSRFLLTARLLAEAGRRPPLTPEELRQLPADLRQLKGDQLWANLVAALDAALDACGALMDHDGKGWQPDPDSTWTWADLKEHATVAFGVVRMLHQNLSTDLPSGVREVLWWDHDIGDDDDGPDDDENGEPVPDAPVLVGTA